MARHSGEGCDHDSMRVGTEGHTEKLACTATLTWREPCWDGGVEGTQGTMIPVGHALGREACLVGYPAHNTVCLEGVRQEGGTRKGPVWNGNPSAK